MNKSCKCKSCKKYYVKETQVYVYIYVYTYICISNDNEEIEHNTIPCIDIS